MDFIWGFLAGTVVMFFYWRSVIIKAIHKVADDIEERLEEEIKILSVNVEQYGETFLLYQADNNRFITQGTCMQDFVNYLSTVPATQIKIVNGSTEAAKALLKTGEHLNEAGNHK